MLTSRRAVRYQGRRPSSTFGARIMCFLTGTGSAAARRFASPWSGERARCRRFWSACSCRRSDAGSLRAAPSNRRHRMPASGIVGVLLGRGERRGVESRRTVHITHAAVGWPRITWCRLRTRAVVRLARAWVGIRRPFHAFVRWVERHHVKNRGGVHEGVVMLSRWRCGVVSRSPARAEVLSADAHRDIAVVLVHRGTSIVAGSRRLVGW